MFPASALPPTSRPAHPWLRAPALLAAMATLAACTSDDTAPSENPPADASASPDTDPTVDGSTASDGSTTDTDPGTDAPVEPAGPNDCTGAGTDAATARCLTPTLPPEYYVAEALAYFDTLDIDASRDSIPDYSDLVARWEWPPWLKLTGYERDNMIESAQGLRQFDPSTVPVRDCRFFDVQPFARCYITFEYENGPCPIYEEFVFNDAGQTTFIEAWSDLDGLRPTTEEDRWAESPDFPRLSTRVPGLGRPDGLIDPAGPAMAAAAAIDPDVADFAARANDFWTTFFAELDTAPEDFFARGCGW